MLEKCSYSWFFYYFCWFCNLVHLGIFENFRNRTAENLYGYSAAEALGRDAIELLVDPRDSSVANNIVQRVTMGESWTGQFPVKNKMGDRFSAVATNTPFYDDDGTLIGIICVSSDSRPFREMVVPQADAKQPDSAFQPRNAVTSKLGLDPEQPLQAAIASKITNLVSLRFFFLLIIVVWHSLIFRTKETGFQGEQQSQVEDTVIRE